MSRTMRRKIVQEVLQMTSRLDFENPEIINPQLSAEDLQNILSLQSQILEEAVVSDDHSQLLDKLCLLAESFTPNAVATVMLYDRSRGTLHVENAPSLNEEAIEAFNGLREGDGSCGNAVYHTEAMYVCNTFEDARWSKIVDVARQFNICSCFSFPVLDAKNQSIGSFAISSFEHRNPEGFHRALLQTCTSICGVILQRRADCEIQKTILDEQLKARKLASLGVLAGGIAHDFNNLLGTILGNVDLVAADLPEGKAKDNLERAIKAIDRAGELTQQLLTFSRGGAPIRKPNDIESIIRESAEFALHGSNVGFTIRGLDKTARCVLNVDGGQIGQLIQNLVINARQAMPDGGMIDIACKNVDHHDHGTLREGNYLKIQVCDTGAGIPQDLQGQIFDPYFTTRTEGTGLGLALCYSIAANHGGHIFVDSAPQQGTCITLYLPSQAGLKTKPVVPAEKSAGSPGGRAIVMDDEEMMRRTMTIMMEHLGFEVLPACNGEEVLSLLQKAAREKKQIDLTIVDLTVPGGMGGMETKDHILAFDPKAKIIVSSGYSADHVLSDYKTHGFSGAVAKPFRMDDLKRVVAQVLK